MDIQPLAQSVARAALARWGRWSPMDVEDATQEAAIHIWQAVQRKPGASSGYYARAGYTGAMGWMAEQARYADGMRVMAGYASAGLDAERQAFHDGKPWQEPLDKTRAEAVAPLLGRGATGQRRAAVLAGLSRGLTQAEIGAELGISKWHVGVERQRARKALAAHTRGQ